MESVITGLVSRFGYWGVLLLIAVENIFPPIPSEVIPVSYTHLDVYKRQGTTWAARAS